MNKIVEFYEKHSISPVRQDIDDLSKHIARREKLYRQLGMPVLLFKNARVCEVGPGGGYNAIAYKLWGGDLTLIEPNLTGRQEIERLFRNKEINEYRVIDDFVENLSINEKFDIVIAEGFLPSIENWNIVFQSLMKLVDVKGILVITVQDEMGMFVERMKRMVGHTAIKNIQKYDEQVNKLVEIFEPQLKTLSGMSRLPQDWVQDQILCEDFNMAGMLSAKKAIEYIGDGWDVLGFSGPDFFEDYSWYKDIEKDYKTEFCSQYDKKSYDLIVAGREAVNIEPEKVKKVRSIIMEIKELEIKFEKSYCEELIDIIIEKLICFRDVIERIDLVLVSFLDDTVAILDSIKKTGEISGLNKFSSFNKMFGRSQQYISFVKTK